MAHFHVRKTKRLTHVSNRHVSLSLIDQRNIKALEILLTNSPSIATILPLTLLHEGLPMPIKLVFYLFLSHMVATRTNNLMLLYHQLTMVADSQCGRRTLPLKPVTLEGLRNSDSSLYQQLRLRVDDIEQLYHGLRFEEIMYAGDIKLSGLQVLCIGLHHYAHGLTLEQMKTFWGGSDTIISAAAGLFTTHIFNGFARKMLWKSYLGAWAPYFKRWSKMIKKRMAHRPNGKFGYAFGRRCNPCAFIDCCQFKDFHRPGAGPLSGGSNAPRRANHYDMQRAFYNGWGHTNGMKAEAAVAPVGLYIWLVTPLTIRWNDLTCAKKSRVAETLERVCLNKLRGREYHMIGDSAYRYCYSRNILAPNDLKFDEATKKHSDFAQIYKVRSQATTCGSVCKMWRKSVAGAAAAAVAAAAALCSQTY